LQGGIEVGTVKAHRRLPSFAHSSAQNCTLASLINTGAPKTEQACAGIQNGLPVAIVVQPAQTKVWI